MAGLKWKKTDRSLLYLAWFILKISEVLFMGMISWFKYPNMPRQAKSEEGPYRPNADAAHMHLGRQMYILQPMITRCW